MKNLALGDLSKSIVSAPLFFIGEQWQPVNEQMGEMFEPLREIMLQSVTQTIHESNNPVASLIFTITPHGLWLLPATPAGERWQPDVPGTPAYIYDCTPLFLNYEDAKALQFELLEIFDRYRQKRGNTTYMLHQFLTPVPIERDKAAFVLPHAGHTKLI